MPQRRKDSSAASLKTPPSLFSCPWPAVGAIMLAVLLGGVRSAAGAEELVYVDDAGVIRWRSDASEVALFGANYCLPSACDYRAAGARFGRFDRIVSVGMFRHVGVRHYHEFFASVRELLTENGVALLHSIGRSDGPSSTSPWIRKYIFPGGYAPALSEVLPVVERLGLWVTDIEILRLHYAKTLRLWRERFAANRARIAALYDERFCRMWEFYLASCELSFRRLGHMVFQAQLAKRQDAVPLTRDYITDWERNQLDTAIAAE